MQRTVKRISRDKEQKKTIEHKIEDFFGSLFVHYRTILGVIIVLGVLVAAIAVATYLSGKNESRVLKAYVEALDVYEPAGRIEKLKEVAAMAPGSKIEARVVYQLAALETKEKRYEDATVHLQQLVDNYSGSELVPDSLDLLGFIALQQERWEQAVKWYEKLTTEAPDNLAAQSGFIGLGMAYEKLGNLEKARSAYELALAGYLQDEALERFNVVNARLGKKPVASTPAAPAA